MNCVYVCDIRMYVPTVDAYSEFLFVRLNSFSKSNEFGRLTDTQ